MDFRFLYTEFQLQYSAQKLSIAATSCHTIFDEEPEKRALDADSPVSLVQAKRLRRQKV
jgi:hypothetical protein